MAAPPARRRNALHSCLLARTAVDDPNGMAAAGADAHADIRPSRRADHRRCRDLFRCRFDSRIDQPRRLRRAADNAEAAQGGRLRGNHAGRPTRPGNDREHRNRQYRQATSRRRILATWDRFHLPWPFGRGVYLWGEPITFAEKLDEAGLECARRLVETRMVEMICEVERRVGHGVAVPAASDGVGPVPRTADG